MVGIGRQDARATKLGRYPMEEARERKRSYCMLGWALSFLVIAIIAAIFGFGGIAGTATSIAVILFWVALAVFVITLLASLVRGRGP